MIRSITEDMEFDSWGWGSKYICFLYGDQKALCGLMARVSGYRSRGPGSILDTTRFSEK
jgi:hypothetical protein